MGGGKKSVRAATGEVFEFIYKMGLVVIAAGEGHIHPIVIG
jgi:hypothetical protein